MSSKHTPRVTAPGVAPLGHPQLGDDRGEMRRLSIRVDDEVEAALAALEAAVPQGVVRGRRSVAVRAAILEAAARRKR